MKESSGAFLTPIDQNLLSWEVFIKRQQSAATVLFPVRSVSDSNRGSLSFNEEVYLHRLSIVFLSKFSHHTKMRLIIYTHNWPHVVRCDAEINSQARQAAVKIGR